MTLPAEQIEEIAKKGWDYLPVCPPNEPNPCFQPYEVARAYKDGYIDALTAERIKHLEYQQKVEDVYESLQELVYLKSIKDIPEYKDEYERRKLLAWAKAKKSVAAFPLTNKT